jgi:hypothetical protein
MKLQKNIEAIYPLSPMQEGLLFHSLYAPESGVYIDQIDFTLAGEINEIYFQLAWQKVVDRHTILRTSFAWKNLRAPLQMVWKQANLPWVNLDWTTLSEKTQQQNLDELLTTQRINGFQFDQAPLMNCIFIKLTNNTHRFIWTHHHILLDGWCLSIIFKEVLSTYLAKLHGENYYLPTPTPYRDYIIWLKAQNQLAASDFWRENLSGFQSSTPLGLANNQLKSSTSHYYEQELRLSSEVSSILQGVVQEHHLTISTILQAAWGLLLSHYSSETDIVFGVTVSGRPASLPGVEQIMGLFINTLPLRLQISPPQSIIAWLKQIQQQMVELQQYSHTSLVDIQSFSEVSGGNPLFESIVAFENYPFDSSLTSENSDLEILEMDSYEQTNYPLTVTGMPGDEIVVKISYDASRLEKDVIERMSQHLHNIFCVIATNPHQAIADISLLDDLEYQQLIYEWNDTATDYPKDKCIHQLFEEQVNRTPDAIAIVFEEQSLTYRELNERANQLAYHLQTLGVQPEVLVGICVERSLEMLVGLLGILKAGGAYVPLDPSYPSERLSYMLVDADINVLLTQQSLLSSLTSTLAQIVCLDDDWDIIATQSRENPPQLVHPDNLAYVMYTSGSTGQPKGVLVVHRSIIRLMFALVSSKFFFNWHLLLLMLLH